MALVLKFVIMGEPRFSELTYFIGSCSNWMSFHMPSFYYVALHDQVLHWILTSFPVSATNIQYRYCSSMSLSLYRVTMASLNALIYWLTMIFFGFSLGNFRRYSIAMAYVGYLGMGVNHPLVHFFFLSL